MVVPKETREKFDGVLSSFLDSVDSKFANLDQNFAFSGWQMTLSNSKCEWETSFLLDRIKRNADGTILSQGSESNHPNEIEEYLRGEHGPVINYDGAIPFPKYIQSGVLQPVTEGWGHDPTIPEYFASSHRPIDLSNICVTKLYSNADMDRPGYLLWADSWEKGEQIRFPLYSLYSRLQDAGLGYGSAPDAVKWNPEINFAKDLITFKEAYERYGGPITTWITLDDPQRPALWDALLRDPNAVEYMRATKNVVTDYIRENFSDTKFYLGQAYHPDHVGEITRGQVSDKDISYYNDLIKDPSTIKADCGDYVDGTVCLFKPDNNISGSQLADVYQYNYNHWGALSDHSDLKWGTAIGYYDNSGNFVASDYNFFYDIQDKIIQTSIPSMDHVANLHSLSGNGSASNPYVSLAVLGFWGSTQLPLIGPYTSGIARLGINAQSNAINWLEKNVGDRFADLMDRGSDKLYDSAKGLYKGLRNYIKPVNKSAVRF